MLPQRKTNLSPKSLPLVKPVDLAIGQATTTAL